MSNGASTPSAFKRVFVGDDAGQAVRVPAADLMHVAGRYGPILRVTSTDAADGVIVSDASRKDVRAFGAVGDGVTNDSAAIQAALDAVGAAGGTVVIPHGLVFRFNRTLFVDPKTTLDGGGELRVMTFADWVGGAPYRGISNRNQAAETITDHDITIQNITIDYTPLGIQDGTDHVIRIRKARRVRIINCVMKGGQSSVALLGTHDSLEDGNTYLDFNNCGSDHWDSVGEARVIGCHMEADTPKQLVNFNPEESTAVITGRTADGFIFMGNTAICRIGTGFNGACQIEPLIAGNTTKNTKIIGNTFKNAWVVMRGNVHNAIIANNTFSDFIHTNAAIYCSVRATVQAPEGLVIAGNTIRNPLTVAPSEGVIVARSPSAVVMGNTIHGTGYSVPPISGVGEPLQALLNWAEGQNLVGRLSGAVRINNGTDNYYGWTDTAGGIPRMRLQTDDNWVWVSTSSTGTDRTVASLAARSDTSEIRWSVPSLFNGAFRLGPQTMAATGTTIAGATDLPGTLCHVTSATAGTQLGVRALPIDGQVQVVVNETAVAINFYPNNSGTAEIDGGGASVPVSIPAGKARAIVRRGAGNFRTLWVS
jgi:hypothetical protein